ncbi:hypothetical protein AAG570_008667 [Ranatra chinensis]|uniref:Peptidase S1 domain-containing protein n=1 Tax=Ranatra chinensis TaxID=642074 RepID=A0ABD0YTQ5_9HEMI
MFLKSLSTFFRIYLTIFVRPFHININQLILINYEGLKNKLDVLIEIVFSDNSNHEVELIIDQENERDYSPVEASGKQEYLCSAGSVCVVISKCTVMAQLMKSSCLQASKLHELTCGYFETEPMVCCPKFFSSDKNQTSDNDCGRPKLHNWWSTNYRGVGSQPWAVRVGFYNKYRNQIEYLCCGSIISKQVVLTAAHCALAKSATHSISSVQIGEYDGSGDPDCTSTFCAHPVVDIPVSHIIIHPGYEAKTFRHNIALLVLKSSMNYSLAAQPICLYPKHQENAFTGLQAQLVGWGRLASQLKVQQHQQQLVMPVLPLERCSLVYGASVPITSNELCVGGQSGRDACSGFGGAPLVLLDQNTKNRYYQIGLVSFGSDRCGAPGIPSVYTRVDKYTEWIIKNSPKDS